MNEYRENVAIDELLKEACRVTGQYATQSEIEIAQAVARNVCLGKIGSIDIQNASREQRKRIVAIAFNIIRNKPLLCRIIGTKDGEKCGSCSKVCCHNAVLQRRFAAEMFPDFKVY